MNRRELEEYLRRNGCEFRRHGKKHDIWINATFRRITSIPRHKRVKPGMIRGICKDLGVPPPRGL